MGDASLNSPAAWCESLDTCVIMEGVTTFTVGGFDSCSALTRVYFPSTLTSFAFGEVQEEFSRCGALSSVYFGGTVLPSLSDSEFYAHSVFSDVPAQCTVYISEAATDGELEAFRAAMLACGLPESVTVTRGTADFYPATYTDEQPTVTDEPTRSGSGSLWILWVVLGLIAALAVVVLLDQTGVLDLSKLGIRIPRFIGKKAVTGRQTVERAQPERRDAPQSRSRAASRPVSRSDDGFDDDLD